MVYNNKFCLMVLFVCISSVSMQQSALCYHSPGVSYRSIGDMYSRSFGIDDGNAIDFDNIVQDKVAPTKRRVAPISLSDNEKLQIVFTALAEAEDRREPIEDNAALVALLEELEFFDGQEEPLFERLNRTDTLFGQAVLAKRFSQPTDDINVLEQRQQLVRELLANEVLFDELVSLMQQVKDAEESYIAFFKDENPISKSLINNLYFGSSIAKYNGNPALLDCYTRLHNVKTVFSMCGTELGTFFFTYLAGKKSFGKAFTWKNAVKGAAAVLGTIYNPWHAVKRIRHTASTEGKQEIAVEMRKAFERNNRQYTQEMVDTGSKMTQRALFVMSGLQLAFNGYMLVNKVLVTKTALDEASQRQGTINYLHTRLNDVAECVRAGTHLLQLAEDNAVIAEGLQSLEQLSSLFEDGDDDLHALVQLLQTGTFKGSPSFFARSGRVLAAYKLMMNVKDDLIPLFEALGEVDACLSMAKLYKEYEGKPVGYSFARYVDSDLPMLDVQDFWNPFIDVNSVVTNSLVLGSDDTNTIILTGTNMNGKSTVLKALLLAVLMAQTGTLVPARSLTISPYSLLASYMNIKDNTAAGESLFQKQVGRTKLLFSDVAELGTGEHAFIAIDELFTGTGADKAQVAAKKVVSRLADNDQVHCVCATHYPLMATIADEVDGCKNYKMDMHINDDGSYVPTYRLCEGISECNIADTMVSSAMDDVNFSLDDIKE